VINYQKKVKVFDSPDENQKIGKRSSRMKTKGNEKHHLSLFFT